MRLIAADSSVAQMALPLGCWKQSHGQHNRTGSPRRAPCASGLLRAPRSSIRTPIGSGESSSFLQSGKSRAAPEDVRSCRDAQVFHAAEDKRMTKAAEIIETGCPSPHLGLVHKQIPFWFGPVAKSLGVSPARLVCGRQPL
jgi:hypothetical protein